MANNSNYCVYVHEFPNGKKYVGITGTDPQKRWMGGVGYKNQDKVYRAILKYGWENIKHKIVVSGVTKEQAQQLEHYLIGELDTIAGGYNVATGGDRINGTYLDSYVLDMIRYVRKKGKYYGGITDFVNIVYDDRNRLEPAEFWNEANRAVLIKHRKYSVTNEDDVLAYWFHILAYFNLYNKMQKGEDVSDWKEPICTFERFVI